MDHSIKEILHKYWGYSEFRPAQEQIINSVLAGRDTLALMPTGGGKSWTYQVPTMARKGVCIVVTPMIALMKDQVDSLYEIGISGTFINSTLEDNELNQRIQEIKEGKYKIV